MGDRAELADPSRYRGVWGRTDRARTWIISLLAAASVTQVFPGALFTKPAVLVAAFVLGLASQGSKICVHTLVQLGVDDAFRGRIFSLYDVLFNVAVVAAAAVAALSYRKAGSRTRGRSDRTRVCPDCDCLRAGGAWCCHWSAEVRQ